MARAKKQRCKGKRRYRDHPEAMRSLRGFKNGSRRDVIPVRAYSCDVCHGWHLTSSDVWDQRRRAA